jgi:hypothetical protein
MARQFIIANGAMPTTAALVKVTTGTAVKTLLQVQAASTVPFVVFEWGISFDGAPSAIECELIDTFAIAATVTAHVAAGVQPLGPDQTASSVALGTTATGYTCPTTEGTTTSARYGDLQILSGPYVKQFPLGREFYVPASHNLRIRVTAAAAVNAYCYVCIEE